MKLPENCEETEALTNRDNQYAERKAGSDQDLQDSSQRKPWSHTQPESQCSADAQQPLFYSAGCGDAFRHMTPVLVPHGVQPLSMVQKWQKQQIQLQKSFKPSIDPSLLKGTGTQTFGVHSEIKGLCDCTHLDRVAILEHLPAAAGKGTVQQPRTPCSVGTL